MCGKPSAYLGVYGKAVPVQKLSIAAEYLAALFRRAAAAGVTKDKVAEAVAVEGQAPKEVAAAVADAYAARAAQLRTAALQSITGMAGCHLADFDWRVNVRYVRPGAAHMVASPRACVT